MSDIQEKTEGVSGDDAIVEKDESATVDATPTPIVEKGDSGIEVKQEPPGDSTKGTDGPDLPPNARPEYLGIDLGTSTCSVALFERGHPVLISIEGDKFMPSVFRIDGEGKQYVGAQAKAALIVDAENTVASIKRHMGDPDYKSTFEGMPDTKWTPTLIAAEYLKKLRQAADLEKGDGKTFVNAVICVPANFEYNKRAATVEAAKLAGFLHVELLEEPIAASIEYGFGTNKDKRILVYDLGGGTFDSTLLEVKTSTSGDSDEFTVRSTEGVPWLGGDDFDKRVAGILAKAFQEQTGIDVYNMENSDIRSSELLNAQQILQTEAEKAKKDLSAKESTEVMIPQVLAVDGQPYALKATITREEFNTAIQDLLDESMDCLEKTLAGPKIKMGDVDQVVLVGGSSKIPAVKDKIVARFKKQPYMAQDPDVCVALGAAIYGEWIQSGRKPDITRIVRHNLGVSLYGGKFDKLIEKGLILNKENPKVSKEAEYTPAFDNAENMKIAIYQTEDDDAQFIRDCTWVTELWLEGIPPKPRDEQKIKVIFSINQQNLIEIEAEALGSDGVRNTLSQELKS